MLVMHLNYAEINITNVCNLNCPDCVSYNNFEFRGHQRWDEYAGLYQQWSKIVDIDCIAIIGGEPMLNPDFMIWVQQIGTLWPNSTIKIVTNGTQLRRWPELYAQLSTTNTQMSISAHGHRNRDMIVHELMTTMAEPITITHAVSDEELQEWQRAYNKIRDASWPDCNRLEDWDNLPPHIQQECQQQFNLDAHQWRQRCYTWIVRDANAVTVEVNLTHMFLPSAVQVVDGKLTLHNSDPRRAIEVCCGRLIHTFFRGRLHKCSQTALLPEFIQQFDVELVDSDRQLINDYVAAEPGWDPTHLTAFIDDIKLGMAVAQCKFCSESEAVGKEFEAGVKKIKFHRKR